MRIVAVLGLMVVAAPALAEPGPKEGEALFAARCASCHSGAVPSMPALEAMRPLEADAVVLKLTEGSMAPMAGGLSAADIRDIAVFITRKSLPAKDDLPEVKAEEPAVAPPAPEATPTATPTTEPTPQ